MKIVDKQYDHFDEKDIFVEQLANILTGCFSIIFILVLDFLVSSLFI